MHHQIKHHITNFMPALVSRNYRLYVTGQGISLIGTWMQSVADQWLLYPILTNNPSMLGLVSAVNLAPTIMLVLITGVLVDRADKRKLLIIFQVVYSLCAFILFLLLQTKTIQVWHVFVMAAVTGVIFAFENPARQSFVVDLVEKKHLPSALSLLGAMFNAARAVGPAIAGVVIAYLGMPMAYFLNFLSFWAVIVGLWIIKIPVVTTETQLSFQTSIFSGFREGIQYIRSEKTLMILFIYVTLLTTFIWPLSTLLPVFAHDIFHVQEAGFGMMQSMYGLGALIGALLYSKVFELVKNSIALFLLSITAAIIIGSIFCGYASSYFVFLSLLCVVGYLVTNIFATVNTLIQMNLRPEYRGRVMGIYSFFTMGGMPIGGLLLAGIIPKVGVRSSFAIGSILFFIGVSILFLCTRKSFVYRINALTSSL